MTSQQSDKRLITYTTGGGTGYGEGWGENNGGRAGGGGGFAGALLDQKRVTISKLRKELRNMRIIAACLSVWLIVESIWMLARMLGVPPT